MKKVGIITIHDVGNNFGSTIQSCAFYKYISDLGYDAKIIDYRPNDKSLKGTIIQLIKNIVFFIPVIIRYIRNRIYYINNCKRTKKIRNFKELKKRLNNSFDIYIAGSDQIWNRTMPRGIDDAYYLKFTDSNNKMSYASSLGMLQNEQNLRKICDKIYDFKYVSVREKKSVVQLSEMGRQNVEFCLDPVFLQKKDYYSKVMSKGKFSKYSNYVLVYAVGQGEINEEFLKRISMDKTVIVVGGLRKKCFGNIFLKDVGPAEFLSLINNADLVIISSFHGVALSIILHKEFRVFPPKINSLRIDNLLELINLQDLVHNENYLDSLIDYNKVDNILCPYIEKSKQYLINSLKEF